MSNKTYMPHDLITYVCEKCCWYEINVPLNSMEIDKTTYFKEGQSRRPKGWKTSVLISLNQNMPTVLMMKFLVFKPGEGYKLKRLLSACSGKVHFILQYFLLSATPAWPYVHTF